MLHDFHSLLTKHGKNHRRITSRVASILASLFSLKWCLENTGEITLTYKTIMEIMAISYNGFVSWIRVFWMTLTRCKLELRIKKGFGIKFTTALHCFIECSGWLLLNLQRFELSLRQNVGFPGEISTEIKLIKCPRAKLINENQRLKLMNSSLCLLN